MHAADIKRPGRTAVIVAALSALGPFSIDTYFPSFPALAEHFGVTEIQVQSTLTFYLVALAVMNLFHGALSDSYGRERVLLVSLSIYTLSALACVFAPSFGWLLALRIIQGLAAGAGMIVSRAVIRDLFEGIQAHKLMAQAAMLWGVSPILAPILGGWLHVWFGWRGPFAFLALFGTALWFACRFALPESLPVNMRQSFHPGNLARAYVHTIGQPAFLLLCLAISFGGGGFLIYIATAPDVAVNILHLSATQFGWLFVPLVAGTILGSGLSSKLAGRIPPKRMVRDGFICMALAAAVNLAINAWFVPGIPWAVLPLTLYTFGFSLVVPVVTVESLDLVPQRRGLASSLQGFSQVIIFALISSAATPLVYKSAIKHAAGLALMMALSYLAYAAMPLTDPFPKAKPSPGPDEPTERDRAGATAEWLRRRR
jgi:DHA1 family bicyclomycin/chloramphenicol resistance-like MFS transporter